MVYCPACEADMDLDEEQVTEGGVVSCTDCGAQFEVVNPHPLELGRLEVDDDDDDEDEDLDEDDDEEEDEDEDEDEDEEEAAYDDEHDLDDGSDEE